MCLSKLLQVVRSSPNNNNNLMALLMLRLPFSAPSHLSCSTRQQAVLPVLDTPVLSFPCQMHLSWAAARPGLLTTFTIARVLASSKFMLWHRFSSLCAPVFFAYIPNVTYIQMLHEGKRWEVGHTGKGILLSTSITERFIMASTNELRERGRSSHAWSSSWSVCMEWISRKVNQAASTERYSPFALPSAF